MTAAAPKNIYQKIAPLAVTFTTVLAISYGLSLLARLCFFFDLFSHFLMQYAVGGLVLCGILMVCRNRKWAGVAFAIACAALIESRLFLQEPLRFAPPGGKPALTVVQYNHFLNNPHMKPILEWLRRNAASFDIVILQEAVPKTAEAMTELKDIYPYQLTEPRTGAFGMVILSRYPFLEKEVIPMPGPRMENVAARILVQPPAMKKPVSVYALHAIPPVAPSYYKVRNYELEILTQRVQADLNANIIFEGDWNVTPYSPWFRDLLKKTGLNYQSYGFFLSPTWPSVLPTNLFKIPIDQFLFSNSLIQTDKYMGPAMGSDHLPVIAGFSEK